MGCPVGRAYRGSDSCKPSKTRPFWLIPRRSVVRPGPWLLLGQRHSVLARDGLLPLRCSWGTSLLSKWTARVILGLLLVGRERPKLTTRGLPLLFSSRRPKRG